MQTISSIATAIVVHTKLNKHGRARKNDKSAKKEKTQDLTKEVSVFVTVAIMQVGFTASCGESDCESLTVTILPWIDRRKSNENNILMILFRETALFVCGLCAYT